jgi:hypothetical protein
VTTTTRPGPPGLSATPGGAPGTAQPGRPGAAGAPGSAGSPGSLSAWRRWRVPTAIVLLILLVGVFVALLHVQPGTSGALDPNDTTPSGTHALAALLAQRGQTLIRETSVREAAAQANGLHTTLVITSPEFLTGGELTTLARVPANLLIVAPGQDALSVLAPGVTVSGFTPQAATAPACRLPGAVQAGSADMGGILLSAPGLEAWRCYPAGAAGLPSLVRYDSGGRTVTVTGTGAPLTNGELGRGGNAALALNLTNSGRRVVWLVPPVPVFAQVPGSGQRSVSSLVPAPVYAIAAELGIAVVLTALWRMRRFGPLIAEPIPVVVRACETVEGHGRLYRSRRARDRAAAALRAAALGRIGPRLGLPQGARPEVICGELAVRTGRDPGKIHAILFGPAPDDDAALVAFATDIDSLEGQVLNP